MPAKKVDGNKILAAIKKGGQKRLEEGAAEATKEVVRLTALYNKVGNEALQPELKKQIGRFKKLAAELTRLSKLN